MANKSLEGEQGWNFGKWYYNRIATNKTTRNLPAAAMIAWPIKVWKMGRAWIEASGIIIETQRTKKSRNLLAAAMIAWPEKV
jgi:hypothetical protein